VNDDVTTIVASFDASLLRRADHQIDRCVAVGVRPGLDVLLRDAIVELFDRLFRKDRLTNPFGFTVRAAGQQRLGPESGLALGRTVGDELDATKLESILVNVELNGRIAEHDDLLGVVVGAQIASEYLWNFRDEG
jgi:hypothetical protein